MATIFPSDDNVFVSPTSSAAGPQLHGAAVQHASVSAMPGVFNYQQHLQRSDINKFPGSPPVTAAMDLVAIGGQLAAAAQPLVLEATSRRNQQFRRLVSDIAEHLNKNDVDNIVWQKELPQKMKGEPALAVLEWLYNHGEFSMDELRPLTQLLKEIHREDVTGKVESYQEMFGKLLINNYNYLYYSTTIYTSLL